MSEVAGTRRALPGCPILVVDPYTDVIGPHQVLARLVDRLSRRGWTFVVAVPARGATYDQFRETGQEVMVVEGVQPYRRAMGFRAHARLGFQGLGAARTLAWAIRARGLGLVHSTSINCWVGGLAARLAGVPSVYHVHDLTLGRTPAAAVFAGSVLAAGADQIVCVSNAAQRALPLKSINAGKSIVLHNAVDPEEFRPDLAARQAVRIDFGLEPDSLLIAALGTLDPRKGQDVLVRAAQIVAGAVGRARFLVIGPNALNDPEGEFRRSLEYLARSLGIQDRVRISGPRADVARVIQACDVVVQPSRVEAGPIVPLEAMACGIPVVATDVGANSEEVLDGVTGLLVESDDPVALARALITLLGDAALREAIGRNARQRVAEHFGIDRQADAMADSYSRLLGQS